MPQVYPNSAVFLPPIIVIIICAITSIKPAPTPQEVLNDHKIDQQIQNIILNDNEQEPQGLTFDVNLDGQYVTRRKILGKSIFLPPGVVVCKKGQIIDPAGSGKCVTPFTRPQTNWGSLLEFLNNKFSLVQANHGHLFTSSPVPEHTTTFKRNVFQIPSATTTLVPDEKTTQIHYDEVTETPNKEATTDSSLLITTTDNLLDMQTTEVITITDNENTTVVNYTDTTSEAETNETVTSGDYSTVSYDDVTMPTTTTKTENCVNLFAKKLKNWSGHYFSEREKVEKLKLNILLAINHVWPVSLSLSNKVNCEGDLNQMAIDQETLTT